MNIQKHNIGPDGRQERLPVTSYPETELAFPGSLTARTYSDSAFADTEAKTSHYRRLFFLILGLALKYRLLIGGACSLGLLAGFLITFMTTPVYRATATIQIDVDAPKVVKLDNAIQTRDSDSVRFYQTQYDLLKSRSLAERVASALELGGPAGFLSPTSASPWSKLIDLFFGSDRSKHQVDLARQKAVAAGIIQHGLTVAPVPESRLVRISFDSPSPRWAQQIANSVADGYIASNLDRRFGATAYARNFLKERLDELKVKLEDSEAALVAYADQQQIVTTPDGPVADSDLKSIVAALQSSTTDRLHAQELWEQAQKTDGLSLPQVLQDPTIQVLRQKRAALMSDYQDKISTYKAAYPDMLRLKSQIDQVDREIKSAVAVIKASLRSAYNASVEQQQMLRQQLDLAKSNVITSRNKQIQYNIIKREADTNRTLYEGLLQQYKDIGVAGAVDTNNIAIIDRAQVPAIPFKPSLKHNLLIALILALLIAAAIIGVLEVIDDTFKSPEEVEEQIGLAVLGVIPVVDEDIWSQIASEPSSPIAESYRSLRTALQFSTDHGAPKTLLVTSARPGEGKSTTALALAINLTQLGMKILLIDADLRNPSQHRFLKMDNTVGLANYLAGASVPNSIFQPTDVSGLFFVPSGPLPPNPAELLGGPKMLSLLTLASEKFDVVVIDAPPVMGLADAPLLASVANGTLLVISAKETRRGMIRGALKRLAFARARIIGVVMNKFDFRTAGYGYGYGYGYGALDHYSYGEPALPIESTSRG